MDTNTQIDTQTQKQVDTDISCQKIESNLISIHNALLNNTFIPEISEMDETKIKAIKYCLRK